MKTIITTAALVLALGAAQAQTTPMPSANHTPTTPATTMPNSNQTPEGSNSLPGSAPATAPATMGPNGTRGTTTPSTTIPAPGSCSPTPGTGGGTTPSTVTPPTCPVTSPR